MNNQNVHESHKSNKKIAKQIFHIKNKAKKIVPLLKISFVSKSKVKKNQ